MKTINCRIYGGLGNQLFQILALSRLCNLYTGWPSLSDFTSAYQVKRSLTSSLVIDSICNVPLETCISSFYSPFGLLQQLRLAKFRLPFSINDTNFPLAGLSYYKSQMPFLIMDGYFQKTFTKESFISSLAYISLSPKMQESLENINSTDVSLHLRGGDFRHIRGLNVCDINYYSKCVTFLESQNLHSFVIVSDDSELGASIIQDLEYFHPNSAFTLKRSHSIIDDFSYLVSSKYKIIGNSTFAFWAMALSNEFSTTYSPGVLGHNKRSFSFDSEIVVAI